MYIKNLEFIPMKSMRFMVIEPTCLLGVMKNRGEEWIVKRREAYTYVQRP